MLVVFFLKFELYLRTSNQLFDHSSRQRLWQHASPACRLLKSCASPAACGRFSHAAPPTRRDVTGLADEALVSWAAWPPHQFRHVASYTLDQNVSLLKLNPQNSGKSPPLNRLT